MKKFQLKNNSISGSVTFPNRREAEDFYFRELMADGAVIGNTVMFDKERDRRRMLRLNKIVDGFKAKGYKVSVDLYIVRRG